MSASIESIFAYRVEGMANSDPAKFAKAYHSKGALLLDGGGRVEGPEAIGEKISEFMVLLGALDVVYDQIISWDEKDQLLVHHDFRYAYASEETPFFIGHSFLILKKEDGEWKIFRQMDFELED